MTNFQHIVECSVESNDSQIREFGRSLVCRIFRCQTDAPIKQTLDSGVVHCIYSFHSTCSHEALFEDIKSNWKLQLQCSELGFKSIIDWDNNFSPKRDKIMQLKVRFIVKTDTILSEKEFKHFFD